MLIGCHVTIRVQLRRPLTELDGWSLNIVPSTITKALKVKGFL